MNQLKPMDLHITFLPVFTAELYLNEDNFSHNIAFDEISLSRIKKRLISCVGFSVPAGQSFLVNVSSDQISNIYWNIVLWEGTRFQHRRQLFSIIIYPKTIMYILETVFHYYHQSDPRTRDRYLMSRPGMVIAIMLFYTYFCLSLGPRLMKNRKPFSLRKTLIVYNLIQVLASIYLVHEGLMASWLYEYSFTCQPLDYTESPSNLRAVRAAHLYFMCKLSELLDTVFFVLRKKDRQISSLHLYHHILMPLGSWIGVRYFPNGHGTFFGLINSFVHVIMYAYYMLAALGPQVQKYLWWKKYLTLLQMVQFAIIFVHSGQTFFNDCSYPKILSVLLVIESIAFLYMFGSFYYENHIKKNVRKTKSAGDLSNLRTSQKSD